MAIMFFLEGVRAAYFEFIYELKDEMNCVHKKFAKFGEQQQINCIWRKSFTESVCAPFLNYVAVEKAIH